MVEFIAPSHKMQGSNKANQGKRNASKKSKIAVQKKGKC